MHNLMKSVESQNAHTCLIQSQCHKRLALKKSLMPGWTEERHTNTNRQFELLGIGVAEITRICINEVLEPLNKMRVLLYSATV